MYFFAPLYFKKPFYQDAPLYDLVEADLLNKALINDYKIISKDQAQDFVKEMKINIPELNEDIGLKSYSGRFGEHFVADFVLLKKFGYNVLIDEIEEVLTFITSLRLVSGAIFYIDLLYFTLRGDVKAGSRDFISVPQYNIHKFLQFKYFYNYQNCYKQINKSSIDILANKLPKIASFNQKYWNILRFFNRYYVSVDLRDKFYYLYLILEDIFRPSKKDMHNHIQKLLDIEKFNNKEIEDILDLAKLSRNQFAHSGFFTASNKSSGFLNPNLKDHKKFRQRVKKVLGKDIICDVLKPHLESYAYKEKSNTEKRHFIYNLFLVCFLKEYYEPLMRSILLKLIDEFYEKDEADVKAYLKGLYQPKNDQSNI